MDVARLPRFAEPAAPRLAELAALLCEAPLGAASFALRRLTQLQVLVLGCGLQYLADPRAFSAWQVNSRAELGGPLKLLRVMMVGPRWNTAAVCGSVGPFRVRRRLRIELGPTARCASYWSMMIFQPLGLRRARSFNSLNAPLGADGALELELPPGDYFVNLRCYRCAEQVAFPRIEVDGAPGIAALQVAPELDEFHAELGRHDSALYRALHHHVHVALRFRRLLPEPWLRRLLLPVGDPGTRFEFGLLRAGEALAFRLDRGLLEHHGVFVTIYDRSSFPALWFEVTREHFVGPPCADESVYLVRVVQLAAPRGSARGGREFRIERVRAQQEIQA